MRHHALTPARIGKHYEQAKIPESSTFVLAASGLMGLGLALYARRRRK